MHAAEAGWLLSRPDFHIDRSRTVRTSGVIPNPNEWHLISDVAHDPELPAGELLGLSILAWRCAACGRLRLDAGRVKDGKHSETFWGYVPAFDEPGPLAPRDADK
jgi:hypothetical protein